MSISYKKKDTFEAQDSSRLYIPEQFGLKQDPPRCPNDMLEQWPTSNGRPVVTVGITTVEKVTIDFQGSYYCVETGQRHYNQELTLRADDVKDALTFRSLNPTDCFTLDRVTIGIGFHWQRDESQTFRGAVRLLRTDAGLVVINEIDVEEYLCSVISSEMRATADLEFLKAHAIISRSWLLGIKQRPDPGHGQKETDEEIIRWQEHDAHTLFDVCADDHCQRYQGLNRTNPAARRAVEATSGQVLTSGGRICDARFSKCCGGRTENFSTAWADEERPYLSSVECPYCNTNDEEVLRQVLNDYDLETRDFHDWQVVYTPEELSRIIREKSGIDFGLITAIRPIERGASGRISKLKITGTKQEITVGKELEIRRWLSPTYLKSSNFDVEQRDNTYIIKGHGWGHGVGLCQIGAAVMAHRGSTATEILSHYFRGAQIETLYE